MDRKQDKTANYESNVCAYDFGVWMKVVSYLIITLFTVN